MVVAFRQNRSGAGSSGRTRLRLGRGARVGTTLLTLGLTAVAGVAFADGPTPVLPSPPTVGPSAAPSSSAPTDPTCVTPAYKITLLSDGTYTGDTLEINLRTFSASDTGGPYNYLWNPNGPDAATIHICYAQLQDGATIVDTSTNPNGDRFTYPTNTLTGYITAADGAPAGASPTPTSSPTATVVPTTPAPTTAAPTTASPTSSTPIVITTTSAPALGGGSGTGGTIAPTATPTTATPADAKLQFRVSWTAKTKALKGIKTVSWQLRSANGKTIIKKGTLKNGQTYTWNGAKPGTYTLWIIKTTGTGKHTKTVILKKVKVTIRASQMDNVRITL